MRGIRYAFDSVNGESARIRWRSGLRSSLGVSLFVCAVYLAFGAPAPAVDIPLIPERAAKPAQPEPERKASSGAEPTRPAVPTQVAVPTSPVLPATESGAPPDLLPVQEDAGCPADMVAVEGEYCTQVQHECLRWLDDTTLPYARCAVYAPKATCSGKRVHMSFCIDRYEYTPEGQQTPKNYASFVEAEKVCSGLGRRVCTESEWNFACEGEDMLPYPYGYVREPLCNQDRSDLFEVNPNKQVLKDHRKASRDMPGCRSPFGVYNMVGNMDEPVLREAQRYAYPFRNGLKGGWWMAGRNRCRPVTTAHDDHYRDIQVGVRCCRDWSRQVQ